MSQDDLGGKKDKSSTTDVEKETVKAENSMTSKEMDYRAKLAAFQELAKPINSQAHAAIKSLIDQQKKADSLYRTKFPRIHEMLGKSYSDVLRQDSLKQPHTGGQNLDSANSKLIMPLGLRVPPPAVPRHEIETLKTLKFTNKILAENKAEDQEIKNKIVQGLEEQGKYLASIADQSNLLIQAITSLSNHTVQFEEAKARGADKQYILSFWGFWAAVISAIISAVNLIYAIYYQPEPVIKVAAPVVNLPAPIVNVAPAPVDFTPLLNGIREIKISGKQSPEAKVHIEK